MKDIVPEYEGLDIYTAREKIVEKLKELDVLVKIEDYKHNVGKCYRCHQTVEPRVSTQWFVKMKPLAEPAIKVVKENKVRFVPDRYSKTYFNWMENIQDWCISRQLWWGHRIPAYYCKDCNEIIVGSTTPTVCTKCNSKNLVQDEDTLDTWFSSALWPFSTLGWPEKTEDLKYFYPTNTLVTGYDIIFFWVARMIFSGIEHMNEIPFDTVFIHGIIRDSQGRKMSKSLGNGIDPLEIIEKYGADALRFSLVIGTSPGTDLRYSPEKLDSAGNFANKIWNASKFVMMNLENHTKELNPPQYDLQVEDKWILSLLNKLIKEVTTNIDKYELGIALEKIYNFTWNEFCDWYIEMVKTRLYDKEDKTRDVALATLHYVLTTSLKVLHPFMPFMTEKIFKTLNPNEESIMLSNWPIEEKVEYSQEEKTIELIKQIIVGIRNLRAQMNIHPSRKSKLIIITNESLEGGVKTLEKLGFAEEVIFQKEKINIPENSACVTAPSVEVYIPLEDLIDKKAETERLTREKEKIQAELQKLNGMLSNKGFLEKAPEKTVTEAKEKQNKFNEMLAVIEEQLNKINL